MSTPTTLLTALPLLALYIFLSLQVITYRRKNLISLGHGGHSVLERRIRAHGNFAEYVPFTLVVMALCELNSVGNILIIISGLLLVLGRYTHAFALSNATPQPLFRTTGMALTFLSLFGLLVGILLIVLKNYGVFPV